MTSQSHTAAVGVPRRPAPPRPAPSGSAPAAPVTYVPVAYDPRLAPASVAGSPGHIGLVYPKARTGRGVWVVLLLLVASVVGFFGWRAVHTGAAAEPGVAYTSPTGHFSARFPSQPTANDQPMHEGRYTGTVHVAGVPGQAFVASFDFSEPVPGGAESFDRRAFAHFTKTSDAPITGIRRLTFAGSPAQQGNVISPRTNELYTALIVAASPHRLYLLMGLTGATFDALKASFAVTP
jgi:hypothetical protein